MEGIWTIDKSLVRLSDPNLDINWDSALPSNEQILKIYLAKQDRYDHPREPIVLTPELVEATVQDLEIKIQNLWGATFIEKPVIEVKSPADYLPRINEICEQVNERFGHGGSFKSPPGMFHSPFVGNIVMPSRFLAFVQPSFDPINIRKEALAETLKVEEFSWDRAYFEETLTEEITHSLFRQLRGEWKEGYIESMQALGPEKEQRISLWNEIMAQYTKEKLALANSPEWGLYVASNKGMLVWANRFARRDYMAVDALSQRTSLANVALVDDVMPDEKSSKIEFDFYRDHPKSYDKQRKFRSSLKRR